MGGAQERIVGDDLNLQVSQQVAHPSPYLPQ